MKKLSIKEGNKEILRAEILREERQQQFQAIAILYRYEKITLKQAQKIREEIIKDYISQRLRYL